MADATGLDKKYVYKISRSGVTLGILQNVSSEFTIQQDINSAGASLTIDVANTPDRQFEATEQILTEDGLPLMDELGQPLLTERQPDIVGNLNSKALIRNNNDIAVYEYSPTYPNGKIVFSGWISRWKASFGGGDSIVITCLSNGSELDNYLVLGAATLDLSQTSTNSSIKAYVDTGAYRRHGQVFTPGSSGVGNCSAILVRLAAEDAAHPIDVKVELWASTNDYYAGGIPLATATRNISSIVATDYIFTFAIPATVISTQTYFFSITPITIDSGFGINVYYQNSSVYAGGDMYQSTFAGGGGYGVWNVTPDGLIATNSDLYFQTYYTAGATSSPYSSQDPTTILRSIIDSYVNRGGTINYGSGTTTLTGLTRSYTFKVNTVLEGIKKCQELAPFDWYWYVDPATDTLYFKETSTTADHKMIYGRHIQSLDLQASVEEVKTQVYFTGGDVGSNVYLFQSQNSAIALAANANRVGLERLSDNRVTLSDTATALMTNFLNDHNAENYQSTITVNANAYDITLFNVGATVGFAGFGSFVDNLILQIVHKEYHSDYVVLGLGILPQRASTQVEDIQRALNDVQTIYNPSSPS